MSWISFLIIAYFLVSLTALADKFLLNNVLGQPVVYVFLVSTLGLAALVLIPFGFFIPEFEQLFFSLVAGFTFTFALFFLYKALKRGEASRIFTTIGSLTAVFTFLFSAIFLKELLNVREILGFVLLVAGGVFISLNFQAKNKSNKNYLLFALLASLMYGISYTSAKYTYTSQGFISAFVWLRIFAFIGGMLFLIRPRNFFAVKQELKKGPLVSHKSNQLILVSGQVSSAFGFLILNYVISLKNPAIVLAAQGLQYVFLFFSTLLISYFFPRILREETKLKVFLQKSLAIIFIAFGLGIIAFA